MWGFERRQPTPPPLRYQEEPGCRPPASSFAFITSVFCCALSAPLPTLPPTRPAEENLDDAASEGAVGVVVPLLKKLNGGDMQAQEQPSARCVGGWVVGLGGRAERLADAAGQSVRPTLEGSRHRGSSSSSCAPSVPLPSVCKHAHPPPPPPPACSGVEELERDICFILGLLAIKVEHQAAICEAGALPTLVSMIRRYAGKNEVHLSGVPAQTCRRTSDAITNLAHENNSIKNKVRQEGGIPPLVTLLHSVDPKVQRAVAGSLRTLAFKNDENKNIIVDLGSLPLLIQMLRAEDTTIHYEVRRQAGRQWGRVPGWVGGWMGAHTGVLRMLQCGRLPWPCCRWLRAKPVPPTLPA